MRPATFVHIYQQIYRNVYDTLQKIQARYIYCYIPVK